MCNSFKVSNLDELENFVGEESATAYKQLLTGINGYVHRLEIFVLSEPILQGYRAIAYIKPSLQGRYFLKINYFKNPKINEITWRISIKDIYNPASSRIPMDVKDKIKKVRSFSFEYFNSDNENYDDDGRWSGLFVTTDIKDIIYIIEILKED